MSRRASSAQRRGFPSSDRGCLASLWRRRACRLRPVGSACCLRAVCGLWRAWQVPWQCGPTSSSMQMPSACLRALSRQFRPSLTTLAFVPPLPSFTCDLLARLFSTLISRLSFPARQCHSMSLRRVYSWTSSWRWWCSSRRRRCERGCTLRLGCMRGRLSLFLLLLPPSDLVSLVIPLRRHP
jgi:hypothetical protein